MFANDPLVGNVVGVAQETVIAEERLRPILKSILTATHRRPTRAVPRRGLQVSILTQHLSVIEDAAPIVAVDSMAALPDVIKHSQCPVRARISCSGVLR